MTDSKIFDVVVAEVWEETSEIRAYELVAVDGRALPAFEPGAHIDVNVAPGITRQYSLFEVDSAAYRIAVKLEPASKGGSLAMHQSIRKGSTLTIGQPRNHFPVDDSDAPKLLLAAGIGITPLLSMASQFSRQHKEFDLHYFTRGPEHTAFRTHLRSQPWNQAVHFAYGLGPADIEEYLLNVLKNVHPDTHVYICGPRPFIEKCMELAQRHVSKSSVHVEYFQGDEAKLSQASGGFQVHCAQSDKTVNIAEDESIAHALVRHGIHIDVMCEQGICGTCLTSVLEGTPDHRDSYLTEEERESNTQMLVCCSRSKSPTLVLDV